MLCAARYIRMSWEACHKEFIYENDNAEIQNENLHN